MNAINDTKTSELAISAKGMGNICDLSMAFVKVWLKNKRQKATIKKHILGRRYDSSLKHICNMTRRHDTRHHDFM